MSDTCEPTIVSRVENLRQAAVASWSEQSSMLALRVAKDNNFRSLDYRAPAGFEPPRHLHYVQDKVLEVLEGSVAVWTPDWCGVLHIGDIISFHAGPPHAWRSIDDQAVHFILIVTPGGPDGFKKFFPTVQQRNLTIASVTELIAAAEVGGMQITGPPLTAKEVERLKVGDSYGSGDDNPNDSHHGTLFQLIPTARPYARFPSTT